MSANTVIDWATVAVLIVSAIAYTRLGRRPRRPYLKARWDDVRQAWVNEEPHDVGPDSLRLLEDLEAHMKAYGARVTDLYDTTPGGGRDN